MPLSINGTTGISGVDGSASAPAIKGTDNNSGISYASDTVNINTGGTTRATIDSGGKLNLTSNIKWASADAYVYSYNGGSDGQVRSGVEYSGNNQFIRYFTGTNERMRVHSGGQVSIGHTTTNTTSNGVLFVPNGTSGFYSGGTHALHIGRGSDDGQAIRFNRSGTDCGSISVTTSSTSYNTSSDYRLKENVEAISDGITRLKTLKPYRFNFISEPKKTVDGFFAHEVTAVPEAIIGVKDEVDEDNKPVHQGIDQSKLVPLLTAALQEAVAKIEVLETKVAALEAG